MIACTRAIHSMTYDSTAEHVAHSIISSDVVMRRSKRNVNIHTIGKIGDYNAIIHLFRLLTKSSPTAYCIFYPCNHIYSLPMQTWCTADVAAVMFGFQIFTHIWTIIQSIQRQKGELERDTSQDSHIIRRIIMTHSTHYFYNTGSLDEAVIWQNLLKK